MNKKGFILSTYVYILLTFFLLILGTTLVVLNNTKMLAKKIKDESIQSSGMDAKFSLILQGDKEIELFVNEEFTDPGYIAQTAKGEILEAVVNSNVDTSNVGDYVIIYTVTHNGETKSITRNVKVERFKFLKIFEYTGDVQEFTVPKAGTYQIELWGAQGGSNSTVGAGAYTKGKINLNKNDKIYIYVGSKGNYTATGVAQEIAGGYNGGGSTGGQACCSRNFGSGGGATDIRYFDDYIPTSNDLEWDSEIGLRSRIMVAAGGGGSYGTSGSLGGGGYGGALVGGNATTANGYGPGGGATQTAGGAGGKCTSESCVGDAGDFGCGGTRLYNNLPTMATGGGGGYYGGGSSGHIDSAGGGSSYISGYTGCVAVTSEGDPKPGCDNGTTDTSCSIHYSDKTFTNMEMKAGNESMPTHDDESTMTGNTGDGYAKITYVGE